MERGKSFSQKLKSSPQRLIQSFRRSSCPEVKIQSNILPSPVKTDSRWYTFFNVTTDQDSDVGPPCNHRLPYVERLYNFSPEEIRDMFIYVIQENSWMLSHDVYAEGDQGDKIYWRDYS